LAAARRIANCIAMTVLRYLGAFAAQGGHAENAACLPPCRSAANRPCREGEG
jgi:hypothetical protein